MESASLATGNVMVKATVQIARMRLSLQIAVSAKIGCFIFLKINIDKQMYHAKVALKWFHLNGHTIGFCRQTQKLEVLCI